MDGIWRIFAGKSAVEREREEDERGSLDRVAGERGRKERGNLTGWGEEVYTYSSYIRAICFLVCFDISSTSTPIRLCLELEKRKIKFLLIFFFLCLVLERRNRILNFFQYLSLNFSSNFPPITFVIILSSFHFLSPSSRHGLREARIFIRVKL